jgi:hypothetical protein
MKFRKHLQKLSVAEMKTHVAPRHTAMDIANLGTESVIREFRECVAVGASTVLDSKDLQQFLCFCNE